KSAKQAENAPKTANISPEWRATGAIVRKRHSFRHIPPNRLVVAGVQLDIRICLPGDGIHRIRDELCTIEGRNDDRNQAGING
ncbi:MAG: hypothetical protein RIC10_00035, partial [Parasphingorhabdus sp.]